MSLLIIFYVYLRLYYKLITIFIIIHWTIYGNVLVNKLFNQKTPFFKSS